MQNEDIEDEDLGMLKSEKITWGGFIVAMFDVLIMAMYLCGIFYAANNAHAVGEGIGPFAVIAIICLLFERFSHSMMRLMSPMKHYQSIQTFEKDGQTIRRTIG